MKFSLNTKYTRLKSSETVLKDGSIVYSDSPVYYQEFYASLCHRPNISTEKNSLLDWLLVLRLDAELHCRRFYSDANTDGLMSILEIKRKDYENCIPK